MKRKWSALLVLGLLAAGLSARGARAQELAPPADDPGLTADMGDDLGDMEPMMAPDGRGGGGMLRGARTDGGGAWAALVGAASVLLFASLWYAVPLIRLWRKG